MRKGQHLNINLAHTSAHHMGKHDCPLLAKKLRLREDGELICSQTRKEMTVFLFQAFHCVHFSFLFHCIWSSRFCSRATSFCEYSPLILQSRFFCCCCCFFTLHITLKRIKTFIWSIGTYIHIWFPFLALRVKIVSCSCQDSLQWLHAKVRLSKVGVERPSPVQINQKLGPLVIELLLQLQF